MPPYRKKIVRIRISGPDKKGIIARMTTFLFRKNLNIEDIDQRILEGFLVMNMVVDISDLKESFKDFRAEGAFLVTAAIRDGSLDSVRILPENDALLRILNPFSPKAFSVAGADLPDEARNGRILTMNAQAGKEIVLRRIHR